MGDATTIIVKENFGDTLLTPEEGDRLRSLILSSVANDHDVILDFAGVRIVGSAFLNAAIGRLYGELSPDLIKSRVRPPKNLTDIGLFTLRRVVENSKAYYADKRFRQALDGWSAIEG